MASEPVFVAGAFFVDRGQRRILLQLRDARAPLDPSCWGLFGGHSLPGETPMQCLLRELQEETGLVLSAAEPRLLRSYFSARLQKQRWVYWIDRAVPREAIVIGEGEDVGWIPVAELPGLKLAPGARADLEYFLAEGPGQNLR